MKSGNIFMHAQADFKSGGVVLQHPAHPPCVRACNYYHNSSYCKVHGIYTETYTHALYPTIPSYQCQVLVSIQETNVTCNYSSIGIDKFTRLNGKPVFHMADRPSQHRARTKNPRFSNRDTAFHNTGYSWSPIALLIISKQVTDTEM